MKKLKSFLGYFMAGMSSVIILAVLPALLFFSTPFLDFTGLKLSPNYSGGEVARTVTHGEYQTEIHRMVFDDTLIGQRKEGFIQVNWTPLKALPAQISEDIDANGDKAADFRVEVKPQTKETKIIPYADWVLGWEGTYHPAETLMIRVRLKNQFQASP